jgi:histidinol-phosphate aminotransferase
MGEEPMVSQGFDRSHRSSNTLDERRRRASAARLDLSGQVNRYGPPETVLRAIRAISGHDLQADPSDVASRLVDRYAELLGVDPAELVAGRGPGELLRAIAARVPVRSVAVPLPAPTEFLAAFPGCGARSDDGPVRTLAQVDAALDGADLVVISNPDLLTGVTLDPEALAEVAGRHPASTLVVDETLVEFLARPSQVSLVGTDADNVVVLRSAAEFSGMGAIRTGVAWSRDPMTLRALFGPQPGAAVSGLDVVGTEAAMTATVWAEDIRRQMVEDGAWLAKALLPLGRVVVGAIASPFRCLITDDLVTNRAADVAAGLANQGVDVLVLGPEHGMSSGALRIAAPRASERAAFAAAVAAVMSPPVELSVAG